MKKYICDVCGWIHDPSSRDPGAGVSSRTPFDDLPDDGVCPICEQGKDVFSTVD